ncbi:MAG: DUF934 domain-containing protein [Deltaproteobacteria bacterium]|nr:DUF934 domain-containing protein [Deltaproteobacteria bacterium]
MSEHMILDRRIAPARWSLYAGLPSDWTASDDTAIPMQDWLRLADAGERLAGVGLIVEGDDDISPLRAHLDHLPVIALHFPRFADGRCYSHARRLRAHWGYQGRLLAFGDVLRDQLLYMSRCGIDAFYMAPGSDLSASLRAFSLYTEHYQYTE